MLEPIPRLVDYDVSPSNGFLPTETPLEQLPDAYYVPWEVLIRNLQGLILTKRIRDMVDGLPVLSTEYLATEAEWRRAYSVLAFLAHGYIWGGNTPCDRVPPSISVPFLETCHHLDLPPVATYAGTVLWNWRLLFPSEPVDSLENLYTLTTFTGSLDESWFYLVSVAIEARAAPCIPMMLNAIAAARVDDSVTVTECLRAFAEILDELGSMLQRMYESCDPHVFYHRIRPFLAGSKNMADAGLPNGVIFDTGDAQDEYVQFSGGSNAQSSVIQFFDLVLGVEHRPTGTSPAAAPPPSAVPAAGAPPPPPPAAMAPSNNFIQEMRTYMPGPHRRFLAHVGRVAGIRAYVSARRHNRALTTAFDACLAMLRAFRDKHIQLVSRYIIVKSREAREQQQQQQQSSSSTTASRSLSPHTQKINAPVPPQRVNLATAAAGTVKKLRGTGGTALIPFLKQARDETGEPAIDAWARRLLNNGPADGPGARLSKMQEGMDGEVKVVGLAGVWSVDDSEGGICHW